MTPQERNKILEVISNEIRTNGPIKLIYFTGIFEGKGYSRSLYAGKGPKRWLNANFPELEVFGPSGKEMLTIRNSSAPVPDPTPIPPPPAPTPTQSIAEMTEAVRQRFIAILSAQIEMHGMVLHSSIPTLIPDWLRYRYSNERLGMWLNRTFRETEFVSRMVNNAGALLLPQTAADIDRCIQIVNQMLSAAGTAPLNDINDRLNQEKLKWESIPVAHNQTLEEWLTDYCPGVFYNESADTIQNIPVSQEANPATVSDAIKQNIVYRHAFLPNAGAPLNALRAATGNQSYTTSSWKKQSVNVFYDNLIGTGEGFLYDDSGEVPRLAFYTGLQSENLQHIYCIMVPNTASSSPRWRYECFCYPGQNDTDGYGRWLCQRFGLASENKDAISVSFSRIEEALDDITVLQAAMLPHFEEVSCRIRHGDPIMPGFSSQLAQYAASWEAILAASAELGIAIPEEGLTMAYIRDILNKKDHLATVLESMRNDYQAAIAAAWEYLDETAGVLYADAAPEADIAAWDAVMNDDQTDENAIHAAVNGLLEPLRALRTLVHCSFPLEEAQDRAQDIVEKHFNARLRIKDIRMYFIETDDSTWEFLSKIDDIESRLKQIQIQTDFAGEPSTVRPDDPELVRQVLRSENNHLVYRHYPAPNKFESAVVSGDYDQVQRMAGNAALMTSMGYSDAQQETISREISNLSGNFSAPILTAGLNLFRLQGNANRQAEKYLLLANVLKDGNAAIHLADLYFRENNCALLWEVYQIHRANFPVEVRQQLLPALMDQGFIQVSEIITTDILGFLAIQDTAALDRFCHDAQLPEEVSQRVMRIRRAVQEPFIRQIVFLDSELYRFIQQQENIDSIQSLGIYHTQETLGELLQMGNYPRGQDILSTARRLWHFVKDWNELAEHTAMLGDDGIRKAKLLWDIYRSRGDSVRMLDLLRRNPELQALHCEEYSDLLFAGGVWQEHFEAFTGIETASPRIRLQLAVCAIHLGNTDCCFPEDLTASEVTDNIDVLIQLTGLMAGSAMTDQLSRLLQLYFEPIMLNCGIETIEQVVTAGGQLDEAVLTQLHDQAEANGHTSLAVFLSGITSSQTPQQQNDAYFTQLWNSLDNASPEQQAQSIRKMEILFRDQYRQNYSQIFPYQLRSTLSAGQAQPEDTVASIIPMLTGEILNKDSLPQILDILAEFGAVWDPALQAKLLELCPADIQQDILLPFFHALRNEAGSKAHRILGKLYFQALESGSMPREYLAEAEEVCLRQVQIHQDMSAAQCVCAIEEKLGRSLFHRFALLYMQNLSSGDSDEAFESEEITSELTIFRQVLEDPACSIDDYLRFCGGFGLFSAQDQQTVEELLPGQEGALTETESIPLLHGFYEHSQDPIYLAAVSRLPLRDNPLAYARLLFHCARSAGGKANFWKTCITYCEKFQIDDILIDALIEMIRKENMSTTKSPQWYNAKSPFGSVRNLCKRAEGFPALSRPESVRELLDEMCLFFSRIDANSTDSENHNSLRTIIELAVASHNEDIVTTRLMDKLLGIYTKLGLAFACHLLRRGSYDSALRQFQALSRCYNQIPYRELVEQLSQMDCAALEQWAGLESSRMLLEHFLLPDGNRPDAQSLRCFTMACITQNKQDVGIQVAEQLIRYFENDSICYKVLLVLCKDNYMEYLPQIQRALAGLYMFFPMDRRSFYTRSREKMLSLLTITDAVMQQLGIPRVIDSLSDFIHKNNIAGSQDLINTVAYQDELHESIRSRFIGTDSQQSTLLVHCLLGSVTANWFDFTARAYQARITPEEFAAHLKLGQHATWGMIRGLVRAGYALSREERQEFIGWISEAEKFLEPKNVIRKLLSDASAILVRNDEESIDLYLLTLPWEEHFVCLSETRPEFMADTLDSCYAWLWNHLHDMPPGRSVQNTLYFYSRLAQDPLRFFWLFRDTERSFQMGEFALTGDIYEFFESCRVVPKDLRRVPEREAMQIRAEHKELCQARKRISRIFLGDAETLAKCRTMKVHSCANIVIELLQSAHARDLSKIAHYFRGTNRRLCRAVLDLVNPAKSDAEKLAICNAFDTDQNARIILTKILSTSSMEDNRYLFTQSLAFGNQMAAEYQKLVANAEWAPIVLRFSSPVSSQALSQVIEIRDDDPEYSSESYTDMDFQNPVQELPADQPEEFVPAFVIQMGTAPEDDELLTVETLRQLSAKCAFDDYEKKLHYAHAIYCLSSKENPAASGETAGALLQFGNEYRNYHLSRLSAADLSDEEKAHSRILARQALMDMAYYTKMHKNRIAGAPTILYADGLHGILCHDFASIDELVDDYRKNREEYQALSQFITDSQIRDIVAQIIQQIRKLEQHYNIAGPRDQNTASYRAAYKAAYDALEQIPFHLTWNEAKNTLLKLLMRSVNNLDKRPFLDVRILNTGIGTRDEFITGVMTNSGRVPAENISLQAIFDDNKSSDIYGYKELLPGEKICFAVPYTAPEDAVTWTYTLNITYHYRDKEYTVDPYHGTLTLEDAAVRTPDVDLYGAHKKLFFFSADAEGKIVGKGFYGRAAQKERLHQLAPEGAQFLDFSHAVVQGFRRTGKTSLLYYFKTYISSKFAGKAIPIYVDCEGFSTQPVQKAFVTSVIYGLEYQMPELAERESWIRLKNAWLLPEEVNDRNPDTLQFFYQALARELDGKGLVLIVDEVDRLFSRVEEIHGAASSLFPSLRAVLHSPECTAAVRMVLCGSNNMLIYNQEQGKLYQLFQEFPKITVGRLFIEDIRSILTDPLAEYGHVEYHPDAIDWIWRYTGGLAWYTKLLGNAAVKRVLEKGRRYIYPIDISHAFDTIVSDKDCKQFIDEGCTDDARLVLDAVSTLATRYGADVSLNQITALLDGALTESQLDSSLTLLTDTLKLLERSSNTRNAYHFTVDIYRRIYRTLDSRFNRTEAPVDRTTLTELSLAPAEEVSTHRIWKRN